MKRSQEKARLETADGLIKPARTEKHEKNKHTSDIYG